MEFNHYPVMLKESIEGLEIKDDGIYVDCTLGGGSHSEEILKKLKTGLLISIDKDIDAINYSSKKLEKYSKNHKIIKSDFKDIKNILKKENIKKIDGFIIDLGISSYQIDEGDRGFSYMQDAVLDMRMDQNQEISAKYIVNNYSEEELSKIIFKYSEEKFSRQIARNIIKEREKKEISTTKELSEIIDNSIPIKYRFKQGHTAKKTFQALRIETNKELDDLDTVLNVLIDSLKKGGRGSVISFHSLEDRIVKNVFREKAKSCICPERQFICTCNKKEEVKIINKKPITASEKELKENSRSLSAKLRIIEKLI